MADITNAMSRRKKGFEARFKQEQEFDFKVRARRDKLFGLWVAEKLGLVAGTADAYAKRLAVQDLELIGDENVLEKVMADLKARHIHVDRAELYEKLLAFNTEARHQIKTEYPNGLGQDHSLSSGE